MDYDEPRPRLLIVDDDAGIRTAFADFLTRHDFIVDTAEDAAAMDASLTRDGADVVILDVMLPGEDGLSICRRLSERRGGAAVIIVSALGEETDRVVGLELGADDYLPKPCSPRELLARVRALLRRRGAAVATAADAPGAFSFAGWRLNVVSRELRAPDGVLVPLSSGEFSMLKAMVDRPQRALSRDQLLDALRGPDAESYDRAIDVAVSRLRRKLDRGQGGRELIRTLRNEGYLFAARVSRV